MSTSTTTAAPQLQTAGQAAIAAGHPMDSSRILLAMTALARRAAEPDPTDEVSSIVSRPVLKTLLSALHFRDVQVMAHARRVAMLAVGMAQQLGWEGRSLRVLETGALLHDIGKIGITDSVLKKPGKLSVDEAEYIARHHKIACNLLQAFRIDPEAITIVAQSHVYFNGALDGSNRIGSEMALGARILAVADAYDSLTNEQPFRAAMRHEEAMKILLDGAGSRFDGNVVAALDRWASGEGLHFIMDRADIAIAVRESAPASPVAAAEAGTLCHIFSYLNVLETLYDGFYVLDSDMRFVVWSAGAEELVGRPAGQMLGQSYTRGLLAHADAEGRALEEADCPVRQVTATGKAACRSVKIQHADGRWRAVELQSIPLFDGHGQLQGVAQIFNDNEAVKAGGEYRDLRAAASRDPLTGIANRGQLETEVERLFNRFKNSGPTPRDDDRFSVIFADIDHFKSLNDNHGHAFGDRVLIDFAATLSEETFNGEFVARYGGEEFVILVPGRNVDETQALADRLRQTITRMRFEENTNVRLTCSFGVAGLRDDDTAESLLNRADEALYAAKRAGRNCVKTGAPLKTDAAPAKKNRSKLELDVQFEACTQSDMIVYKLSGFVDETGAKLRTVDEEHVVMWMGKGKLFGGWGTTPDEQPVEVSVRIGGMREGRGAAKYVPIEVHIEPRGKAPKVEVFEQRARKIVEALRSYLVAR